VAGLLSIEHLGISFVGRGGSVQVVKGVELKVGEKEVVGIVGESGCGKSVTALAVMRLLPPGGRVVKGRIVFDGQDLLSLGPRQMQAVRGSQIAMIFQEPMSALNPVLTVGFQVAEVLMAHKGLSKPEAMEAAVEMLGRVGIADPLRAARSYPHELSGGMRQRVMIAMALVLGPRLLIADEPTTALDVTIQAQILSLLKHMRKELGMAVMLITHDLGVVAQLAEVVAVMYTGRIVELAPAAELFSRPLHPYTLGLMSCLPALAPDRGMLPAIRGSVPPMEALPSGCKFRERCDYATSRCAQSEPALVDVGGGHLVRCYLHHKEVGE